MNHDITHCTGIGCKVKKSCVRYLAHVELEEDPKYTYLGVSYMMPPENKRYGCEYYWEDSDVKKDAKK